MPKIGVAQFKERGIPLPFFVHRFSKFLRFKNIIQKIYAFALIIILSHKSLPYLIGNPVNLQRLDRFLLTTRKISEKVSKDFRECGPTRF